MFTVNTDNIKRVLTALEPIADDIYARVEGNTMFIKTLNSGNTAMVNVAVDVESDEDTSFKFDRKRMAAMFKSIKSNKCQFTITDKITVQGGKNTFVGEQLRQVAILEKNPNMDIDVIVVVSGKDFNDYIDALSVLDEVITFEFIDGRFILRSQPKLSNEQMVMEFDIISVHKNVGNARTDFTPTLLGPIVKAISRFEKVSIMFSDWSMLKLVCEYDGITVEYYAAPAVVNKEDD